MPSTANISPLSITDGKISNEARIAHAKLAKATEGQILVAQSNGKFAAKSLAGDVTLDSSGSTTSNVAVSADGTTVVTGATGAKGDTGSTGSQGATGATGAAGTDATVSATTVNAAGAIMHTDVPASDTGFVKRTGAETYDVDTATYSTTGHTHAHADLTSIDANQHLDWTTDRGATNIHAGNYTDTTANETVTLSGDVTGSGTTAISCVVSNDSHTHSTSTLTGLGGAAEKDVGTGSGDVAQGNHTHGDLYYTETEADALHTSIISGYSSQISTVALDLVLGLAGKSATGHTHAHADLTSIDANQHLDWTTDRGSTNIHAGNYTDTTYSIGDGGLTQKNFTTADNTKLDTFKGKHTAIVTGDDSTTIFHVTHNLGTYYVVVSVRHPIPTGSGSASSIGEMFDYNQYTLMDVGHSVAPGVEVATINGAGNPCDNCIAIRFPDAPADGDEYLVTIIG